MRNIHLSVGALERCSAQSAHCLMVLINGLASSRAFAHYCVLFMLSWVMMPTQQLLPQPFRWSKREIIIRKRHGRNRKKKSYVSSEEKINGLFRGNLSSFQVHENTPLTSISFSLLNPVQSQHLDFTLRSFFQSLIGDVCFFKNWKAFIVFRVDWFVFFC